METEFLKPKEIIQLLPIEQIKTYGINFSDEEGFDHELIIQKPAYINIPKIKQVIQNEFTITFICENQRIVIWQKAKLMQIINY